MARYRRYSYIYTDGTESHMTSGLSPVELSNKHWLNNLKIEPVELTRDEVLNPQTVIRSPLATNPLYFDVGDFLTEASKLLEAQKLSTLLNQKTLKQVMPFYPKKDLPVYGLLQYAIGFGGTEWMSALLRHGANVINDIADNPQKVNCRYTSFHYALMMDPSVEKLSMLLEHGAETSMPFGINPLEYTEGNEASSRLLFEQGFMPDDAIENKGAKAEMLEYYRLWVAQNAQCLLDKELKPARLTRTI